MHVIYEHSKSLPTHDLTTTVILRYMLRIRNTGGPMLLCCKYMCVNHKLKFTDVTQIMLHFWPVNQTVIYQQSPKQTSNWYPDYYFTLDHSEPFNKIFMNKGYFKMYPSSLNFGLDMDWQITLVNYSIFNIILSTVSAQCTGNKYSHVWYFCGALFWV